MRVQGSKTASEARRALIEGVKACEVCRPDSWLGLLD
ncbi:DUF6233 domain-containing protein [Streptomyces ardesiacus]